MRWLVVLMVLGFVGMAAADEGATTVTGRVTDVVGRPVAGARVYVLPRAGVPIHARTGKDGGTASRSRRWARTAS